MASGFSNAFQQGILYCAPDAGPQGVEFGTLNVTNLTGFGVGQGVSVLSIAALPVGTPIGFQIQVAEPSPLLYFRTAALSDTVTIITPTGQPINPNKNNAFLTSNSGYFQPSPTNKYNIIYTPGAAVIAGGVIMEFQTLVQNTLGQYLNMAQLVTIDAGDSKNSTVEVGTTIALNTNSAVPNTLRIVFRNVPVNKGINTMVMVPTLLSATAVQAIGGDGIATTDGAATENISLIAGQNYVYTYFSRVKGTFSGTLMLTIQSVGTSLLVPALFIYPTADMGWFIDRQLNALNSTYQPGTVMPSQVDIDTNKDMDELMSMLKEVLSLLKTRRVSREVM